MISFKDIAVGSDHVIRFLHVATGTRVQFPAFITQFSDSYQVNWGNEQIFGRMDPIKPYQGTSRNIQLAFDVVSFSLSDSRENMDNYSTLIQMLYPVYNTPLAGGNKGFGRTLKAPPIMRIQFMNLIKSNSENSPEEGLLGCINGLSFDPNREAGFFTQSNEILPKVFNVSFQFTPLHESTLGFEENKFINTGFPYGRPDASNQTGEGQGTAEVSSFNQNIITNGNS
tara:strand:+ start:1820 stop:2500 length:681 start_codon:yes stop_codon:yes gene_type:complete